MIVRTAGTGTLTALAPFPRQGFGWIRDVWGVGWGGSSEEVPIFPPTPHSY